MIGFEIVSEDDDPYIPAVGNKRLENEREGNDMIGTKGEDVFGILEEMDTQPPMLPVIFKDDPSRFVSLIQGDHIQEAVDIIDGRCAGDHQGLKNPGLEDL